VTQIKVNPFRVNSSLAKLTLPDGGISVVSAVGMNNSRSIALSAARKLASGLIVFAALLASGCAHLQKPPVISETKIIPVKEDAETLQRIDALAHFATGIHHELNDESKEANDQFVQAAFSDLKNEDLVLDVARRLVRDGENEQAIDLLTKAASQPNPPGSIYAWLGLTYLQVGRTNDAVAANKKAIQLAPDNLAAYQNLAGLHLQLGRTNDAVTVLEEAASRTNASPEFLIGTADILARFHRQNLFTDEENKAQTLRLLDAAAEKKPDNPLVLQRIADLYLLHSQAEKAEPIYLQLLKRFPNIPGLRERLANIYIRLDRNAEAEKLLEEISRENPTDPTTHFFLGSLAYEAKQYDKAAEHYETALKLNPNFEPLYYDLAGVHIARQQPAEALALLEKARGKFKLTFILEFYSGIAQGMLENWPEALSRLTSAELVAKTSEPNRLTHVFYYQLGSILERSGNIPEAVKNLRKALELSPDYADALNYLGYMWADRGENLDEARSMIERAVKAEPDNAAFLDSLAWVLFKLKRGEEALKYMDKAIALSEKPDPTLYDHLGDIHADLKEIDKAREAYAKALAVKPDEKIQQKLEKLTTR
jgi:tetratricopeptide (TPR) repeat protein